MDEEWFDQVEDFGAQVFNAANQGGTKKGVPKKGGPKKGGSKKGTKNHHLSFAEKLEIIKEARTKNNHSYLARKFNVPRPTIVRVLNEEEKTLQAINEGADKSQKHIKSTKFGLDDVLCQWIRDMRSRDVPVSGNLLQVRLLLLAFSQIFRKKLGNWHIRWASTILKEAMAGWENSKSGIPLFLNRCKEKPLRWI